MPAKESITTILANKKLSSELVEIANKVADSQRITPDEGLLLYQKADLGYLGTLANFIREKKHGDNTYFNRNFHMEPTNV